MAPTPGSLITWIPTSSFYPPSNNTRALRQELLLSDTKKSIVIANSFIHNTLQKWSIPVVTHNILLCMTRFNP